MKLKMIGFIALSLIVAWNYWAVILGLLALVAVERVIDWVIARIRKRNKS